MTDVSLIFFVRSWPLFASFALLAIPRQRRTAFGLCFATIGFCFTLFSAQSGLPVASHGTFLLCAAAALPILALLHAPPPTQIAPIFLVASATAWTCLESDLFRVSIGCVALLLAWLLAALFTERRVRPVYRWARAFLAAGILTLTGAMLVGFQLHVTPTYMLAGSIITVAGLIMMLCDYGVEGLQRYHAPLLATLRAGTFLAAMTGLWHVEASDAVRNVTFALTFFAVAAMLYMGAPSIAFCGCLAAMASMLPAMQGAALVLTLTACLGAFIDQKPFVDNWLLSFLAPSPLMPAALCLFWALASQSALLAYALLGLALSQIFLRAPRFPGALAWRASPSLWLLLVLGLLSPLLLMDIPVVKGRIP